MTSVASWEPRACWEHPVCTAKVAAELPLWAGVLNGPAERTFTHTLTHAHAHTTVRVLSDHSSRSKSAFTYTTHEESGDVRTEA